MLTIYCLQSDSPQGFDAHAFSDKKKKKRRKKNHSQQHHNHLRGKKTGGGHNRWHSYALFSEKRGKENCFGERRKKKEEEINVFSIILQNKVRRRKKTGAIIHNYRITFILEFFFSTTVSN